MKKFLLVLVLLAGSALALLFWVRPGSAPEPTARSTGESAPAPEDIAEPIRPARAAVEEAASSAAPDRAPMAVDRQTLRDQALRSFEPWPDALRAQLVALHPADLMDFLDDDELLVHDDARSMVEEIHGLCGVPLALLVAEANGAALDAVPDRDQQMNVAWCRALTERGGAHASRDRLSELLSIALSIDTAGTPRRARARDDVERARVQGSAQLLELLAHGDPMTAGFAMIELWNRRDTGLLDDWLPLERLSETQRGQVFEAVFTTLDCRALGDCRLSNLSAARLCVMPGIQCADQTSLEGALYQSFSPNQMDAYSRLVAAIFRLRRG